MHAYEGCTVTGRNNIIYFNQSYLNPECYGTANFTYSCFSTSMAGTGNIIGNPAFVSLATFNLNLTSSSPCIDAGSPSDPLDPDGSRADMGALPYDHSQGAEDLPDASQPREFAFYPPAPNPFNPTTVLSFDLPAASFVKLEVFDINGRAVLSGSGPEGGLRSATPTTETWFPAGTHQIPFDGSGLPSGIYLAKLTAGDWQQTQKLVLMK
ncbi:MAG TPA: T9SS type A sorting domain-containing protein [bacterium]